MRPQIGELYYHFKHNPDVFNDHAYEIVGFGFSTDSDREVVLYKPLYEGSILDNTEMTAMCRSLDDFTGQVERNGKTFDRFIKITDPDLQRRLLNSKTS